MLQAKKGDNIKDMSYKTTIIIIIIIIILCRKYKSEDVHVFMCIQLDRMIGYLHMKVRQLIYGWQVS